MAVVSDRLDSFMPASLTVSLTLIVLESYTLARMLVGLSLPRGLLDIRVSRIVALLVFDLALVVPDAVESNVLGDFIPFSVGAVIVLGALCVLSYSQPSHSDCIQLPSHQHRHLRAIASVCCSLRPKDQLRVHVRASWSLPSLNLLSQYTWRNLHALRLRCLSVR